MRKVDPVKHEEKMREILEAAGRCFMRDGFQGATIANICNEANVSAGHLYHYFPSKEAIIGAMAEADLEETAQRFAQLMEGSNIVTALVSEIDRVKDHHDRAGGRALLLDVLAEAGRNAAMAKILQKHSRGMKALLGEFLRTGQTRGEVDANLDAEIAAGILVSLIDGSKTLALRDPKLDMKKHIKMLKMLIDRFLTAPLADRSK